MHPDFFLSCQFVTSKIFLELAFLLKVCCLNYPQHLSHILKCCSSLFYSICTHSSQLINSLPSFVSAPAIDILSCANLFVSSSTCWVHFEIPAAYLISDTAIVLMSTILFFPFNRLFRMRFNLCTYLGMRSVFLSPASEITRYS